MPTDQCVALTSETLHQLDRGKFSATLEAALQRVVQDCIDRPTDDRTRKVIVQFDVVPTYEEEDRVVYCDGAKAKYQVRARLPDWESKQLDFGVQRDGKLLFNEDAPDNHRQSTMEFEDADQVRSR